MTILNIALMGQRAAIASNTAAFNTLSGETIEVSKLHVVSHLGAVCAARGATHFLSWFAGTFSVQPDFDTLVEHVASRLELALEEWRATISATLNAPPPDDALQLALIGWSRRNDSAIHLRCELFQRASSQPLEAPLRKFLRSSHTAPWQIYLPGVPELDDRDTTMQDIARRQAAAYPAPELGCGGLLTVAILEPIGRLHLEHYPID